MYLLDQKDAPIPVKMNHMPPMCFLVRGKKIVNLFRNANTAGANNPNDPVYPIRGGQGVGVSGEALSTPGVGAEPANIPPSLSSSRFIIPPLGGHQQSALDKDGASDWSRNTWRSGLLANCSGSEARRLPGV